MKLNRIGNTEKLFGRNLFYYLKHSTQQNEKREYFFVFSLCAILLLSGCGTSQKATDGKVAKETKEAKFEELIKDSRKVQGYFDLYQKEDNLYLAVPKERINEKFLINMELARGIGSSFLYGGLMLNRESLLVSFEDHEGKIFLVQHPHRYLAKEGTPEEKAVALSFSSSVIEAAKIEAHNKDSTEVLINVYDWFVGDISGISERVGFAVSDNPDKPGRVSFDKSRSHLEVLQGFPENINIQAKLTFKNSEQEGPRTVPDARYIPLSLFYTLAKLPEQPMEPRLADDRTGYFMTVHKDFSDDSETFFKRYVNKWRLECDGPPGEDGLCDPKKPIVYYIDHTVPVEYRKPMMEGVEAWSVAYESAGFKNAVQVKMLPDSIMAGDIRYSTLRWNTSDQPMYGAIGPSVVDPRTGEILDADILFEANMMLGTKDSYRELVEPREAIDQIFNVTEQELELFSRGLETKSFYHEMSMQMELIHSVLIAKKKISAGDPVPKEYINEFVRWVTMHEVGHTLGLRHNFRSSIDTPMDKLYERKWAKEKGVFSSAMEYPTVNIHPNSKDKDGYYYNPGVGSYDRWVISYGYTPDNEKAKEIARQAAKQGHSYGTDEDARGPGAVDPHINVFDLGADPLTWGKERAQLLNDMMLQIPEIVLNDNTPYYKTTELFQTYLFQYARTLPPAVKYIGGQHQYRDHVGDPDGRMPFVPVSKKKQQEALNMIIDYAFNLKAIEVPTKVYQKMGSNRWNHWGNDNTYQDRIDYPIHKIILGIQSSLLQQLLNPMRLERIRDTELKFGEENTLGIPDLMNQVTNAVWSEILTSPATNIESNRRDLQRAYLDEVITLVTDAPKNTPADARSIARAQLKQLLSKLSNRLSSSHFDDYSRAHLEESKARMEAGLEAGLDLKN
ncbi:zinc-dependent metalloprotease [Salegentibacter sp. F14]